MLGAGSEEPLSLRIHLGTPLCPSRQGRLKERAMTQTKTPKIYGESPYVFETRLRPPAGAIAVNSQLSERGSRAVC